MSSNTHEALVPQLSAACLADIEGLQASAVGFCRGECMEVPARLAGSFETLTSHLFLGTTVSAVEWNKHASNVDGYMALASKFKSQADAKATVFQQATPEQGVAPLLLFKQVDDAVAITEYTGVAPGELPFESKGALAVDRSDRRYVFVCSHRVRDDRCGYCGPILVELIRKSIEKRYPGAPVEVYACSHIGGHVYAGNVLCYSRFGGRCFGCVTPQEVDALVDYIAGHTSRAVPPELATRLRGAMLFVE